MRIVEENNTVLHSIYHESNEDKDNINIAGTLVHEELKFSHAQPSQQKYAKQPLIADLNDTITNAHVPKSKQEIIQDVILSLAMEQRAIAQFIQAEAKHIQAYIQHSQEPNIAPSYQHDFQVDLVRIIEGLVEKQKMSMRLLDMTKVLLKEE
jgi:hypothetical protein